MGHSTRGFAIRLSHAALWLLVVGAFLPPLDATQSQDSVSKRYIGSIDNRLAIHMTLAMRAGSLQGSYYYDTIHTPIRVQGSIDSTGRWVFDEFDRSGAKTARFDTTMISNGILAGSWTRTGSDQHLPVLLEAESATGTPVGADDRALVVEEKVVIQRRDSKDNLPAGRDKDVIVHYPRIFGLRNKSVLAGVNSAATVRKVLGNSIEDYKRDLAGWLDEANYEVNYNRDYLLGITFWQSGCGAYPDTQYGSVALNLKTGNEIRASDVFEPSSMRRLAALVNGRLHAYIRESIKEWAASGSDVAEDFPPNAKFRVKDLDKIRIEQRGVTFLWQFDFPHVIKALEPPDGGFFFTYDELKDYIRKDGLLGVNIR
jgi:hypothetical protein